MPREGHKVGCQCAICKKLDPSVAVAEKPKPARVVKPRKKKVVEVAEVTEEAVPDGMAPFGKIAVGDLFVARRHLYRKVSDENAVNLTVESPGDEPIFFDANELINIRRVTPHALDEM